MYREKIIIIVIKYDKMYSSAKDVSNECLSLIIYDDLKTKHNAYFNDVNWSIILLRKKVLISEE